MHKRTRIFSTSGFTSALELNQMIRNLLENGYSLDDIKIYAKTIEDTYSILTMQEAKVTIKDKYVIFRTIVSNCSSVFIQENTLDEFTFNVLFRSGYFTIAFATENLFEKSIHIKDNIYLYRLIGSVVYKFSYNIQTFNEHVFIDPEHNFQNFVKVDDSRYRIVKIFDNSDCYLMAKLTYFLDFQLLEEINNMNLFFVYYSSYSSFFERYFRVAYKYRAYRTNQNLRVFVSRE